MKKYIKQITAISLSIIVACSFFTTAFAETIYYYYGYLYTFINNEKVSLYGVEEGKTDVDVPNEINGRAVVDIANRAFKDNSEITSLVLTNAKNLERIGSFAFNNCVNLSGEIEIPAYVTEVCTGAFQGCTSLKSVVYNASCDYVPAQCFNGCSDLESVYLNNGITSIAENAFANCSSLEYFEIESTVTSIASSAFKNDPNLILGVYTDTAGHNYAAEKNMPYILLDGPKIGDVNGDGMVDILDSTEIQKFAAESTVFTDEQFELADINDDGFVDVIDALLVQKYVVGEYDIPPIIYNS